MTLSTEATFNKIMAWLCVLALMLISTVALASAQHNSGIPLPPKRLPPTGNCYDDNIFYGAVPPGGEKSPVLVFAHGLTGLAEDWWSANSISGLNDMYSLAYQAGYRTAFVNLNVDPDAPDCEVVRWPGNDMFGNGYALSRQLETITDHYNVNQVDIIAHSKGGIDAQSAIVWSRAWSRVRSVFTLGTPHQGSILADYLWSPEGFWVSFALGQLDDATFSMRTASMKWFRRITDASSLNENVHYYYGAGNFWRTTDTIYELTGEWLQAHPEGGDNDGIVTVNSTHLDYADPLFVQAWNHTEVYKGSNAFPYIHQILLDNEPGKFKSYLPLLTGLGDVTGSWMNAEDTSQTKTSSFIFRGGLLNAVAAELIPVEPQAESVKFYLLTTDREVNATLSAPDGSRYALTSVPNRGESPFQGAFLSGLTIQRPAPGQWTLYLDGIQGTAYFLIASFDSPLQVQLSGLPDRPIQTEEMIQLAAEVRGLESRVWVDQVALQTIRPTSGTARAILQEKKAGAGASLTHIFLHEGIYGVSVTVLGRTVGGLAFERTFIHSQAIVPVGKGDNDLSILTELLEEDRVWQDSNNSAGAGPEK